jgi:hypothetical protein
MKRILAILLVFAAGVITAKATTDEPYGPVVVYRVEGVAAASPISTTTIYTPAIDGMYEFVAYEKDINGDGCAQPTVYFTRSNGDVINEAVGGGIGGSQTFFSKAGTPIQFNIPSGNCTYDYLVELIKD